MLPSLLLTFREGLEAALIVGIILSYLDQSGHANRRHWVWGAVGVALALSLALAITLQAIGARLEGEAEYIFEGIAMLLAVAVLTWMIFWMRQQARHIKGDLEAGMRGALRRGHNWGLFSLVFLAVFREGVETALFLTAASLVTDAGTTIVGGLIGLVLAVGASWAIYSSTVRLNVRRFFDVTSIMLLVFAAGLFAHGLYELHEAGWLPALAEDVWNLKPVLSDRSTVGSLLRALVGYNDNPTLLEIIGYIGYWVIVATAVTRWTNRRPAGKAAATGAQPSV